MHDAPPSSPSPPTGPLDRLLEVMRTLRSPSGCPWDRKQTLASLKPFLIEECYEAVEALESGDLGLLREELGDILLQLVFQSQICAEQGVFTFEDVIRGLTEKLERRHPHVFGDAQAETAEAVLRNWDAIKRDERGEGSPVDGVPRHLPALLKAAQVQSRAARAGFDWPDAGPVFRKLDEELGELHEAIRGRSPGAVRDELGDVLFTVVNLSRFLGCSAEEALQATTAKFMRRFREVERRARASDMRLEACGLEELDALWDAVKAEESGSPAADAPRETGELSP